MDCETSIVKYILFLFNLLCSICGILLIVFGVLLLNNVQDFNRHADDLQVQQIPMVLIVLGSVILVISFFGCCGAIRESYCMSMTYSVFLLILLILQLVLIVVVWTNKANLAEAVSKIVDKSWEERGSNVGVMDALQTGFKCCGKNGVIDYGLSPPASCCEDGNCANPLNIYLRGCKSAFRDFWETKSDLIKYVGLGVALVEAIGFIFACCLANNIRNYKRRAAY